MKKLVCLVFTLLAATVHADVEMITRYHPEGSYEKGAYSFFFASHESDVTLNNYDIQFEDRADFDGYFNTVMVTDHLGGIIDLGKTSCAAIPHYNLQTGPYPGVGHGGYPYKEDRQLDQMFWMRYSEAWDRLQTGSKSSALVKKDHCYLVHRVDSDQRVVVLFHVKDYTSDRSVVLDEVEVFLKQKLKNIKL